MSVDCVHQVALPVCACRAESAGRPGGNGSHADVLPARQPAVAGPEGGHAEGALPEDRRHEARHADRGPLRTLPRYATAS